MKENPEKEEREKEKRFARFLADFLQDNAADRTLRAFVVQVENIVQIRGLIELVLLAVLLDQLLRHSEIIEVVDR
jgi:hypothetical protein